MRGFVPWSGRRDLHHIKFSSGVIDALTHMGYHMVHGGTTMSVGIEWCTKLCHGVQCYAEECNGAYLYSTKNDDAQQVVGVFPSKRSPNEDIKHTLGFGIPKFGKRVDHRVNCELPFITLRHCTLTQGIWLLSLNALITS